jgi:hypothetical protein
MPLRVPWVFHQHPCTVDHSLLLEHLQQLLPSLASQLWRARQ